MDPSILQMFLKKFHEEEEQEVKKLKKRLEMLHKKLDIMARGGWGHAAIFEVWLVFKGLVKRAAWRGSSELHFYDGCYRKVEGSTPTQASLLHP